MNYEKLRMTADKSEGDFVRTLQGQTGTGFQEGTHVHKDWYQKTVSFDEGMQALQADVDEREDILDRRDSMQPSVNANGKFCFRYQDGREFFPTPHALNQLGVSCNASTFFIRSMIENPTNHKGEVMFERDVKDASTLATVLRNALRRIQPDKKFRWRTYKDGTMRAWLTETYAPVDNRWYMEALKDVLPKGRLSHWRGDADTIYCNILIPDSIIDYGQDDDSDYGAMVSIGNCEIGKRRISQMPSLFRSICMNGCIWGQVSGKKISRVHRGKIDLGELRVQIQDNIEAQLNLIPAGMERFMASRDLEITGSLKNVIATVCKESKLSKKESSEVLGQYLKHESDHRNLFGVVNAVTRAGQVLDNESWVKFDNLGGKLLDTTPAKWENVLKRASSWEDKDVNAVFTGKVAV